RKFLKHGDRAEMVAHKVQLTVEFRDPAGGSAGGRAHLSNQEAAIFRGKKVVRDGGFDGFSREQEARISGLADIEEEDPVLPLESTQQAAARKKFSGRVEVAVVRFVSDVAGRRYRHGLDYLAVIVRVLIEIDHCQEIGGLVRLISGPNVQSLLFL